MPEPTDPESTPTPEPTPTPSLVNEPAPAEPAPAEPAPVAEPLTVADLTIPEGYVIDETTSTEFLDVFNNAELTPAEKANALINLHKQTAEAALAKDSQAWDNMQTEWRTAVETDADIGGAKLQPALTNIAKLIDEYGSDDLRGILDLTGAGNNVHVIKFLSKIADKLTEPTAVIGSPIGASGEQSAAQRLFPSMKG